MQQFLKEAVSFKLSDYMASRLHKAYGAVRDAHPFRHLYHTDSRNHMSAKKRALTAKADEAQFNLAKKYIESQGTAQDSGQRRLGTAPSDLYRGQQKKQNNQERTSISRYVLAPELNSAKNNIRTRTKTVGQDSRITVEKAADNSSYATAANLERSITVYFSDRMRKSKRGKLWRARRDSEVQSSYRKCGATRYENYNQSEDQQRTQHLQQQQEQQQKLEQQAMQKSISFSVRRRATSNSRPKQQNLCKTMSSYDWHKQLAQQQSNNSPAQRQVCLLRKKTADLCQKLRGISDPNSARDGSRLPRRKQAIKINTESGNTSYKSPERAPQQPPWIENKSSQQWFKKQEAIIKINIHKSIQLREKLKATKLIGSMNNKTVTQLIRQVDI